MKNNSPKSTLQISKYEPKILHTYWLIKTNPNTTKKAVYFDSVDPNDSYMQSESEPIESIFSTIPTLEDIQFADKLKYGLINERKEYQPKTRSVQTKRVRPKSAMRRPKSPEIVRRRPASVLSNFSTQSSYGERYMSTPLPVGGGHTSRSTKDYSYTFRRGRPLSGQKPVTIYDKYMRILEPQPPPNSKEEFLDVAEIKGCNCFRNGS